MTKPLSTTALLYGILAMAAASQLQAAELRVIAGGSMTASMYGHSHADSHSHSRSHSSLSLHAHPHDAQK